MVGDALDVALLLDMCLCCSIMVVVLLGLSAKAGSAHRGWEEW